MSSTSTSTSAATLTASSKVGSSVGDGEPSLMWKDRSGMEGSPLFGRNHLEDIIGAIDALGTVEVFFEHPDADERKCFIRGSATTGFTLEVADWTKPFPQVVGRREPDQGQIRLACADGALEVTVRSSQVLTAEDVVAITFGWMTTGFVESKFRLSELTDRSHHIVGK
jgi:hypothetical protein